MDMVYVVVYKTRSKRDKIDEFDTKLTLDELKKAINFLERHNEAVAQIQKTKEGVRYKLDYRRRLPGGGQFRKTYTRYKRVGRPRIVDRVKEYLDNYHRQHPEEKLTLSNTEMVKYIEKHISEELVPSANRYKLTKSTLRNAKLMLGL
jgi:hypothetical protein